MIDITPKIILVGKPNVGKSTLFNTIIGRKEAIVGEEVGLTRDYQEIKSKINNFNFLLFDTAGIRLENEGISLYSYKYTQKKIEEADLIFFLIDGSKELTVEDYNCAKYLRKFINKVILLANKIELKNSKNLINLGYELGLGIPTGITAKHRSANDVIYNRIKNFFKVDFSSHENIEKELSKNYKNKISISISGKPNTGKSTIFNSIYGSSRVIVSNKAGTTRDSIKEKIIYKNNHIDIVDTAGFKKKNKAAKNQIDKSSNYFSRKEIRYANIVLLVFDATQPFSNIELSLANFIISEGRAVLLVFNKWDLVTDKNKVEKEILSRVNDYFFDIKDVPAVFISAINQSCKIKIFKEIEIIFTKWNKKIKTSDLNQWLQNEFIGKESKKKSFITTKFRYVTQTKNRPPTFALFCNTKNKINLSHVRSFKNNLRKKFRLEGIPIRINLKTSKNPFEKKN